MDAIDSSCAAQAALAKPSAPTEAKTLEQVTSFLGSQGDQVDVIGLFMAARSEQISKRKFVCELDGQEFTTLNIMRVHFERKYAREAQAWWIQQSAQAR